MTWSDTPSSRHRNQSGWVRRAENRRILEAHGYRCHVCGGRGDQVDHVIPLSQWPDGDVPANKRPICGPCHRRKTASEAAQARAARSSRRPAEAHPGRR